MSMESTVDIHKNMCTCAKLSKRCNIYNDLMLSIGATNDFVVPKNLNV